MLQQQQQPISYKEFTQLHNLDYKPHQQQCVDWCLEQEGAPIREPIREPRFCSIRRTPRTPSLGGGTLTGAKAPTKLVASGGQPRPEPLLETPRVGRSPHPEPHLDYPRTPSLGGGTPKGRSPHHGGLIADEMGLGKTIQIISLINANPLPTTLIVVPVALLAQWHEALTKLGKASAHDVIYYHGSSRKKHHLSAATTTTTDPNNPSRTTYSFRPQQNQTIIALTTYGEISRPKSRTDRAPASPIHSQEWSRIVFDEAHHLRNPKTNVHQAALQLSSKIKWLLTGTPIQNSRRDFFALCSIIGIPSHLYSGPTPNLKVLASNYLMKRTKQQLQIPMPDLKEHNIRVKWADPNERELSAKLHSQLGILRSDEQPRHQPNHHQEPQHRSVRIPQLDNSLVRYLRARQMCVLPGLVKAPILQAHQEELLMDAVDEDRSHTGDELNPNPNLNLNPVHSEATAEFLSNATTPSSKLTAITQHITDSFQTDGQRRKLIFCEFRKELDFLQDALNNSGIITGRIDGSTPKQLKQATIASDQIQVLLLQIKTCSEGLNLQKYSDVYIVTPQWNPTIEEQAVCRAYRIGQSNQVNVYRFVMDNEELGLEETMEMKVMTRQSVKREDRAILEY